MSGTNGNSPNGWTRTTLGEIGKYHNGRGFKKREWAEAGRPIIRIQNLTDPTKPFNHYADDDVDPRNEVHAGDLLVSWAATLDVFEWDGPDAVLNQHIFKVESFINPRLHFYVLKNALDALYAKTHGSGMVHITRKRFESTPVLLPPDDEQRVICELLDDRLRLIREGEGAFRGALRGLDHYRLAVMRDAVEGEWRHGPLIEALHSLRNGMFVSRPAPSPPGIPIYRISAVRPMALDATDLRYAPANTDGHERYLVQPGDLLFTRYSGNPEFVGACARVREGVEPALHPDKLIRGVVNPDVADPAFLELACSAGRTWQEIRASRKTTAGQVGIAGKQLAAVTVPLPPLDKQREIVTATAERLRPAEALRQRLLRSVSDVETLERSLLHDALRPRVGLRNGA